MGAKSMTGFGRGRAEAAGIQVEVELSSVNRKVFEVRVTLPRPLLVLESRVHALIHEKVARGCINGNVKINVSGHARSQTVSVDTCMAAGYVVAFRKAAMDLGLKDDLTARMLLQLPQILSTEDVAADTERVWRLLHSATGAALHELLQMRETEGAQLVRDIRRRMSRLTSLWKRIRKRAPRIARDCAAALQARLARLGVQMNADQEPLRREILLFAERSDISEELVRLESHFRQMEELTQSQKPVGRTLDFLCQEMFREINTIGSKASDLVVARSVVEFKSELEAIREQVQNIE